MVDATHIKEGLRDLELRHDVNLSLLHLLAKSSQLYRQVGLCLLCLLTKTVLLCKQGKLGRQLLVKGTNGLLILVPFFFSFSFNYLLMLAELMDHPLVGRTPVLKGRHLHQHLKQKTMVKTRRQEVIKHYTTDGGIPLISQREQKPPSPLRSVHHKDLGLSP